MKGFHPETEEGGRGEKEEERTPEFNPQQSPLPAKDETKSIDSQEKGDEKGRKPKSLKEKA